MKKLISSVILISALFASTGCASMFTDKTKTIPVTTNPEKASIPVYSSLGTKIFESKTPCNITLPKKDLVNSKVVISLEGYKTNEIQLGSIIEPRGSLTAAA